MFQKIKEKIINVPYYEILIPFLIFCTILFLGTIFLFPVFSSFVFIKLSDFIILATLFALLWYSFETRQLKNATRTTNELQQLPFFVLIYDEQKLVLKNEGKGMAYNIAIKPIKIGDETFRFGKQWYYCKSGDESPLLITIDKEDGSTSHLSFKDSFTKFLHAVHSLIPDKKEKFEILFGHPLKNKDHQIIILKIPNDPANIEDIEFYNFDE